MRAIVFQRYGSPGEVLHLADIPEPAIADDEALVGVRASSANAADWHLVRGEPYIARLSFGPRRPRHPVPGCDVAGEVLAVGRSVTSLRRGDVVFGSAFPRFGAFAERVAAREDHLAPTPAGLSLGQAAAVPTAALTALQGLRDHGRVEPGHRVLVIGASGGVGSFAVQIAKWLGAEVTAAASTPKLDMVRSLGADHVIDRIVLDPTATGERYDVILQAGGTSSPSDCRRALTRAGTLVTISGDAEGRWLGPIGRLVVARLSAPLVSQRLETFTVRPSRQDLRLLAQRIEGGEIRPVIDRTFPLAEVPEAIRRLEEGRVQGKSVIVV